MTARWPDTFRKREPHQDPGDALLLRVVEMMRDYGMHEPECPARLVGKAQAGIGVYLTPAECTCWLRHSDGSHEGRTDAQ